MTTITGDNIRMFLTMEELENKLYAIEDQITVREDLIKECVGSLYPSILRDEIKRLHKWKIKRDDFIAEKEMEI